ncbi:MAG: hypothetical protein MUP74_04290 [Desulfobacterales bacterium]|nr:hypothetical protein [Desulfobacterales bacterium]
MKAHLPPFEEIEHTADLRLIFKGPRITALLIDTPLGEVVEALKKERGAWFRGEDVLEGKTVSVKFKELSIRQGIERIFSEVNHCFIFNPEGELEGGYFIRRQSGAKAAAFNSKTQPVRRPVVRKKKGVLRPNP